MTWVGEVCSRCGLLVTTLEYSVYVPGQAGTPSQIEFSDAWHGTPS